MAENYAEEVKKVKRVLDKLLPLMLANEEVSPEAYHAAGHALEWMELCENALNVKRADTVCPFCKAEFSLREASIACPACGYAVDNWIGDDDLEERLNADLTTYRTNSLDTKHMAKPLGYYCDGNLFDELKEQYGSQLQGLTKQQKLFFILSIAGNLCSQAEGEEDALTKPEITTIVARINRELTADDKENLLIALANQVREQR